LAGLIGYPGKKVLGERHLRCKHEIISHKRLFRPTRKGTGASRIRGDSPLVWMTFLQMNVPGWKLYPLTGPLSGRWSVGVSGNWRLTFGFDGADAILVDYQDYH
jgi:proteic killer suppression protein